MRPYELVCAFRMKEGQDVAGIEAVKKILTDAQASIKSEEDMGDRELAYEIDKESRGRYRLFNIDLEQEKLPKIEDALRLRGEILRYLFVVKGE
ncbi:MAG: 30S ribosomal protein S6 [Spirochaetaceae bacterium]|jgi:small subunit ribosomal protein S6|nr:30S ribosomal protein S6 [Spirochaetaceae bacterium]